MAYCQLKLNGITVEGSPKLYNVGNPAKTSKTLDKQLQWTLTHRLQDFNNPKDGYLPLKAIVKAAIWSEMKANLDDLLNFRKIHLMLEVRYCYRFINRTKTSPFLYVFIKVLP